MDTIRLITDTIRKHPADVAQGLGLGILGTIATIVAFAL